MSLSDMDWSAPPKSDPPEGGGPEWKTDPEPRTLDNGYPIYTLSSVGINLVCVCSSKSYAEEIARLHNEKLR